jgi:hypothetical protein
VITVRDVLIGTLLIAALLTLAYLRDAYEPAPEETPRVGEELSS